MERPSAHALDVDVQRGLRITRPDEVRVQRLGQVVADGCDGGLHGLCEQLAAENSTEPTRFVGRTEPVVALRFQLQGVFEVVECSENRLLQGSAAAPQRPSQSRTSLPRLGLFGHPITVTRHDPDGVDAVPVGTGVGYGAHLREKAGVAFNDLGVEPEVRRSVHICDTKLTGVALGGDLVAKRLEARLFPIVIVCHGGDLVKS